MKTFTVILLITAALQSCQCKTYRLVKVEGGRRIPQDITHDTDANTVTIVVGDVSEYENKIPTVNFHDFDTAYVVFKDIRRQLCLLSKSPIQFATPSIYQLGETNLTLNYKATVMHSLTNQNVQEIAGERISSFCMDYKTHFMNLVPVYDQPHKRDVHVPDHAPCDHNCGICSVSYEDAEYGLTTFGK